MKVAALDFGKARVGVAVSDELGMLAHPRPHLDATHVKPLLAALAELAREEALECFVLGLPRTLDGQEGQAARRVRQFARLLQQATALPVHWIDEWLSTRQAQARLHEQGLDTRRSRERIDSASAAVLLQAWLDRQRLRANPAGEPWE